MTARPTHASAPHTTPGNTMNKAEGPPPNQGQEAWPLYDLCIDVPHPAASPSCPSFHVIGPLPPSNSLEHELSEANSLGQIQRFCFPEFDDSVESSTNGNDGPKLNRHDQYMLGIKGFQNHGFSLQLKDGQRVYGHVRRYLPCHLSAGSRYDVGRRGIRALAILTRASGGDAIYTAVLKSVEAISAQQAALVDKALRSHPEPQKWFLHKLSAHHQHLCSAFASLPFEERRPMILTMDGLELGSQLLTEVDTTKFLLPTSLLVPTSDDSAFSFSNLTTPIVPLLRCLGVANVLRVVSAMLSERRIILISASPARLTTCARSALAILAQGLLQWQHIFIPVLPVHLMQYLAAPVPYLIGILAGLAQSRLHQVGEMGEVVVINLDTNALETRGMDSAHITQKIPDLVRNAAADPSTTQPGGMGNASEILGQDLLEVLKVDKRTLQGESALSNVGETAAKASLAFKSAFGILKEKSRQYLQQRNGSVEGEYDDEPDSTGANIPNHDNTFLAPDYIYTEACQNEVAEEEARVSFATFFLAMYGDMRWYLSSQPNGLPLLDTTRFLQQKQDIGETRGSPMWFLLQNFCQTQMLQQFANARIAEIRSRLPITKESPLFSQCSNYHRVHKIDFHVGNVRRVARQVAQANPSRLIVLTAARRTAMTLTSNKAYEGDVAKAIAQLVEDCRESSSFLADVMSVIWLRLRDSRGMQWKHGLLSLHLLRNLMYHGPLAAVAEATDGLEKLRSMKYYSESRPQNANQVRMAAAHLYDLLVDRAKLFMIRRVCANKRRCLKLPREQQPRLLRDNRLHLSVPFRVLHAAVQPGASVAVGSAPAYAPATNPQLAAQPVVQPPQDLLGFDTLSSTRPPASETPHLQRAPVGLTSQQPSAPSSSGAKVEDIFGIFADVSISTANPSAPFSTQQPTPAAPQGYYAGRIQPTQSHVQLQPTTAARRGPYAVNAPPTQNQSQPQPAGVPSFPGHQSSFSSQQPQFGTLPPEANQAQCSRNPAALSSGNLGNLLAQGISPPPPPQYNTQLARAPVSPYPGVGPRVGLTPPPPPQGVYLHQHQQYALAASFPGQQPLLHSPPPQQPQMLYSGQYPGQTPPPPPRANLSQFDPMAR